MGRGLYETQRSPCFGFTPVLDLIGIMALSCKDIDLIHWKLKGLPPLGQLHDETFHVLETWHDSTLEGTLWGPISWSRGGLGPAERSHT